MGTEQRNKPLPPFHQSTPPEIGIVIGYRVACNRDYTCRIENLPLPTTDYSIYSVPTARNTKPSPATADAKRQLWRRERCVCSPRCCDDYNE